MTGRREAKKAFRRTAILDAALELLEQYPGEELTVEQIATKANVSHATVFNLVGTRYEIMYALLERQVVGTSEALRGRCDELLRDPVDGMAEIIGASVDSFIVRQRALKQVLSETTGRAVPLDKSALVELLSRCMERAQRDGLLDPAFHPVGLARRAFASYLISLVSWASDVIDAEDLRLVANQGLLTVLTAASAEPHRERFRSELVELTERYALLELADRPVPTH